jgi:hyperpolarization activated cyclic nucleotide-gated potassium channel 1
MNIRITPSRMDPHQTLRNFRNPFTIMSDFSLNLLDPIRSPADDSKEQHLSLTARRRRFIMSKPVLNQSTAAKFKSARSKIKGLQLWSNMRSEIQVYGTGSNLFDVYGSYRTHLQLIMKNKKHEQKAEVEGLKWPQWVMGPENRFKQGWNCLVILLLLYTFILTPYLIAFEEVVIGSDWFYADVFVDSCFFLDIVVTLNTAYLNAEGEYVTSRRQIFLNYLKGMLVVDFLSIFPFYLFGESSSARSNVFIRFLRMTRLTRIVRASKLVNIMKHFSNSETMQSLISFLKMYSGVTRLITAVFVVLLILHFTACMWYYSARLDDFNPDTWIFRKNLQDESKGMLYITSLYWALTTLTTVGYGDIAAFTEGEMVICMIWMMFGVGFYSFTVGTLSSVLSSMDAKSAIINDKLSMVNLFAKDTQLPEQLVKRVSKFVKSQAEEVTLDDKQRQVLLMQLPKAVRYEIAMSMHGQAASKVEFFKGQEVAFVGNIVPLLQYMKMTDSEFIYLYGDYPEEVFFVVSGRVNYVYSKQSFKTIVTGSYFGEIELLDQVPREFSAMTEGECEFLVMSKALFETVLKEYPKVAQRLREVAQERRLRNLAAQHELVELLERVHILKEITLEALAGVRKCRGQRVHRSKSMCDYKELRSGARGDLKRFHLEMRMQSLRQEMWELKGLSKTN